MQATEPEVAQGQVWKCRADQDCYPEHVRIVERYPFSRVEDGPLWIVEAVGHVSHLMRTPETSLRELYRLLPS
jgi:hypothetical protein